MAKNLLTLIVILVFVLLGAAYFFFSAGVEDDKPGEEYTNLDGIGSGGGDGPDTPAGNGGSGQSMTIDTASGQLSVIDVRTLASTRDLGSGFYQLGAADQVDRPFSVSFSEFDSGFAVSLNEEPIVETRKEAERYLADLLNIRTEDLCRLNAVVGVPHGVNAYLSGENLGFSFCPGSVELE